MTTPCFILEDQHRGFVAGCDEAGCGPWAGPVVAGAVVFNRHQPIDALLRLLNDSKMLTSRRREQAYEALWNAKGESCYIGVGAASVEEIDTLNIRKASQLAMQRAVEALAVTPHYVLVDGTGLPCWSHKAEAVVKGDQKSYSIAAASIIAKVTRDRMMTELSTFYPEYGWQKNAGYGTKTHQLAIREHGITPHHRKSFAPIKHFLGVFS